MKKVVRYLVIFALILVFQINANFEPILYKTYNSRLVLFLGMNDVYNAQSEAQLDGLFAFMRKYNLQKDLKGNHSPTPFRVKIIVHASDNEHDRFQKAFTLKNVFHSSSLFTSIKKHDACFILPRSQWPEDTNKIDNVLIAKSLYTNESLEELTIFNLFFQFFSQAIKGYFYALRQASCSLGHVRFLKAELESTHTIVITNFPSAHLFFEAMLLGGKPASVSNLELLPDNSDEQKRFIAYTYNGKKLSIDEINLCELSFDQRVLVGLARKMLNPIAAYSECRAHSWKPHVTSKGKFRPLPLSEKELNKSLSEN